ncbi:MAG: hypothetical protein LBK29_04045 [Oscillospiraceae bacterium]|nr:hypothetical protein [Oscillospiraceae bacterium]
MWFKVQFLKENFKSMSHTYMRMVLGQAFFFNGSSMESRTGGAQPGVRDRSGIKRVSPVRRAVPGAVPAIPF